MRYEPGCETSILRAPRLAAIIRWAYIFVGAGAFDGPK